MLVPPSSLEDTKIRQVARMEDILRRDFVRDFSTIFFIWNFSEMFGSADSAHFVVVEDGKAGKKIPV